ncbi:MAG: aminotransferase class I/II-fold pyridoxal phosphate-dependent enzyme [Planctomycetaceae bacterium]|nr:aminotransferase class I/II-fold pyridoxal phosphate-dependent enzyme [Planctomycetaceae bacterium]
MNLAELLRPFSPPETNFVDRLRYWKDAKANDLALRFLQDGENKEISLTYAGLDERARAVAAKLTSMNMRGQRALLLYQSGLDFVEGFVGCHYAGVVPVPAFPPRRNRNMGRIDAISRDAQAAVALTTNDVLERIDRATLSDSPSLQRASWLATDGVPSELASDWVHPRLTSDDIALIQYTSGSTGTPKGVVLTQFNVMANCRMISEAFQVSTDDHAISWLPLYHDMGLIGGIINPLFMGCSVTLMSPVAMLTRPIRWLRAVSNFRARITGGPNFAYSLCVERITDEMCEGLDLSCLKLAFNGAEPVRADVMERFSKKFAPYGFSHKAHYPCYGMAETTLLVTGADPNKEPTIVEFVASDLEKYQVREPKPGEEAPTRRLVGCGRTVGDEEVIIVEHETCTLARPDQIGEIWISSPSVGQGYWKKPQETAEVFHATLVDDPSQTRFLRTGDLGFFYRGELFVSGRLKDMIIVHGVNRYPQDIETTVERCSKHLRPAGAAAFAFERDDKELLAVVCEVERQHDVDWNDVIQSVRSAVTAEHELPPDVVILVRSSSIPKTSSGKIQRTACRKYFEEGGLLVVAQWSAWQPAETIEAGADVVGVGAGTTSAESSNVNADVVEMVMQTVKAVAKERAKALALDTNIVVDLGLDSLERMSIASRLEEIYGGNFPNEILQEIETIREIALAITTHIGTHPIQHVATAAESAAKIRRFHSSEELPTSFYKVEEMPEYLRFERTRNLILSTGARNPFFSVHDGVISDTTRIDGRELISFASYNYLGLSGHPAVSESAKQAIDRFGTSVSASRVVSGEKTIHKELEAEIANFFGVEDVITFPGGHATNETVLGHLVSAGDLVLHDALAHNSLIQGAELSGARRRAFDHNNWQQLDEILGEIRTDYRRVIIVIEGLYSMDGDYPNLAKFVEVKKRHRCWMYVDEAHSFGTLGKTGRGVAEMFDVKRSDVECWMGTMSKSFASCGGFVGAAKSLVQYLRYTTPGYVFAAGMPPANVGAALGALRQLQKEPERVTRLIENSKLFLRLAKAAGIDTGMSSNSPIIPVIIGDSVKALQISEYLFHAGINAQPILYPAVEEARARVRFFITAAHSEAQIRQTVEVLSQALQAVAPETIRPAAQIA